MPQTVDTWAAMIAARDTLLAEAISPEWAFTWEIWPAFQIQYGTVLEACRRRSMVAVQASADGKLTGQWLVNKDSFLVWYDRHQARVAKREEKAGVA